jgi:hypothetical protein
MATASAFAAVPCGYLRREAAENCYVLVASGVVNRHSRCMAGCDANVIERHEVRIDGLLLSLELACVVAAQDGATLRAGRCG